MVTFRDLFNECVVFLLNVMLCEAAANAFVYMCWCCIQQVMLLFTSTKTHDCVCIACVCLRIAHVKERQQRRTTTVRRERPLVVSSPLFNKKNCMYSNLVGDERKECFIIFFS